jgi:tetratricopeptide (TPR) repeat protein
MRAIPIFAVIASAPLLASAVPLTQPAPSPSALAKLTPQALIASGCGFASAAEAPPPGKAPVAMPLIEGLAPIRYPVTTTSQEAQRYFNQGMAFLYGFEFPKAERSFAAGSARDPGCAMCKWGEALAIGPYINSGPSGVERIARALTLTTQALAQPGITDKERALITALQQRYAPKGPKKQKGVHAVTFANAMQAVSDRWPGDDMIMVLAAEAAMNVRPWDYWEADNATPRPWAQRAIGLVETVLARNPDQPEAQHLYIHLTEASTTPGRAERAADMLESAAPASAHLVHMPSHTYYRVGRFADSVKVNMQAIDVDEAMARRLNEDPKFYGYFRHHTHFILSAAEQMGDRDKALKAAGDLEASIPVKMAADNIMIQARLTTALQARAQFARTLAESLAIPEPDPAMAQLRQIWWALRAEALARAGKIPAARQEIATMRAARGRKATGGKPRDVEFAAMIKLSETLALARIAEAEGNPKGAIRLLQSAAGIERGFSYNEPPVWHQPVDAALGALLLRTGDAKGAKAAFDRAITRRPGNAWVLWGRAQAEAQLGERQASAQTMALYRKSWAGAQAPTLARL